ncbi:MAG: phosphonate C-P lyase system protein PhnL [Alphaproteobacteria bacterium]|nr:phosphonate C-P lyase system protein PhnL [Alphaproteobacteria bacterium]
MTTMLKIEQVAKTFTLHVQGGVEISVFQGLDLTVDAGECVVLSGGSGVGKSTLMRMIDANYVCPSGRILVRHDEDWVDMASAHPHQIIEVRRRTIAYVSQFLRVVPRVATLDIVSEPLRAVGVDAEEARARAAGLLQRLRIPESLWSLSPITFSGGEQQRVNIARGFILGRPVMLLDEPTASLDAANREVVLDLIREARNRGAAIVGIFHDADIRDAVSTRAFEMAHYARQAA